MLKRILLMASLVLIAVIGGAAQQETPAVRVSARGEPLERGLARLVFWDNKAKPNVIIGQVAVMFGRPEWKKEYEDPAKFNAMTNGKIWRLGNNFWTELFTDVPIAISGQKLDPGAYYLGATRSADGNEWNLAVIDPEKVRAVRLDALYIEKAPIMFKAPLTQEKITTQADKVTVIFVHTDPDPSISTLRITWGDLQLSAPVKVEVPKP